MNYPATYPTDAPLVTLTHPSATLWQLELHNGADNRVTTAFLQTALTPALDAVEREWRAAQRDGKGNAALVIVGNLSQDKFFSNGLDFEASLKQEGFFPRIFDPWLSRLLAFPMPTICAINGHAFAAGFLLSLVCDYRVITSGRAWCCMNEVHFGAPLPPSFAAVLRAKISDAATLRKAALEGHRFTPQELLDAGVVDRLADGGSKGVLSAAFELAKEVEAGAKTGVWGMIKMEIYRDIILACSEERSSQSRLHLAKL